MTDRPATLGELKAHGYQPLPVKAELRKNLIAKLRGGEPLLSGMQGYEDSVIPQLVNALLAGQDVIFLGERGQAKSRLARSLPSLLDEWMPVLADTEIPEDPYRPITPQGKAMVAERGEAAELHWLHRDERYAEKLATPDITIADLIGEVDPIKIAEGRYLDDALTLHYGLVPRVNRGIFAINELPDLAERIQVGLLNLLEERDIQIRGHNIRLPLDVFIVATANPDDYTNRGRIITPLKDRYGAQIRTHYPASLAEEIAIVEQEASGFELGDCGLTVLPFMKEIIAEITHQARRSPDINQRSGVSVRTSITSYETLVANACRRALRLGEPEAVPRISDLPFIMPSFQGKVEFEAMQEGQEDKITASIVQSAVQAVFDRHHDLDALEAVAAAFGNGLTVDTGEAMPASDYTQIGERVPDLAAVLAPGAAAVQAAELEFILEGLHLHKLLNKHRLGGRSTYTE